MEKELKEAIENFIDKLFELNQKYIREEKEEEKRLTCSLIENLTSLVED